MAFEAEVSQDSFLPIHGRRNSATLSSSKDPVDICYFAPRDVREKLDYVGLFPERDGFQFKKISQSLKVNSSIPNYYNMIITPIFMSRLCSFKKEYLLKVLRVMDKMFTLYLLITIINIA